MDQERPAGLAPEVSFIGILPAYPVFEIAWNPDGNLLAYSIDVERGEENYHREIEMRAPPSWDLQQRWVAPSAAYNLTWAPNGQSMAFSLVTDKISARLALAQLGEDNWQELDPGNAGWKLLSMEWLDDSTLLLMSGCGTSCRKAYTLRVPEGIVSKLRNHWDNAPDVGVSGVVFDFSPDRQPCWWRAESGWCGELKSENEVLLLVVQNQDHLSTR